MNEFDTTTVSEGNKTVSAVPQVHTELSGGSYIAVSELPDMPSCRVGLGNAKRGTLPENSGMLDSDGLPKISLAKADMNEYRRFNDTLHAIWGVCKAAGFRLEGRVTLVDKRTGRVWK